ncbi:hypothetical protein DY000_02005887 [Brassica cretica]|uniref:Uncharacterized protein n=1 Tax=Brassica cretica TaxID=69181 RepID=A0ABQ7CFM4_BRACR|nr:hypothetical protein DY000_02005887 [Brassica cretica]
MASLHPCPPWDNRGTEEKILVIPSSINPLCILKHDFRRVVGISVWWWLANQSHLLHCQTRRSFSLEISRHLPLQKQNQALESPRWLQKQDQKQCRTQTTILKPPQRPLQSPGLMNLQPESSKKDLNHEPAETSAVTNHTDCNHLPP